MPFTVTHTPPNINSKVTVKFAGLMLLRPNGQRDCQIGIHRYSPTHTFQVMLIVNKPNLPPTLLRLINGPLMSGLSIATNPPGNGFRVFTKDDNPLDRTRPNDNPLDYRWTIDIHARHRGVNFNEGAEPIATLNDGTLYTSNLSKERIKPALVRLGAREELHYVAADLSASIELSGDTLLVMGWREFGKAKTFRLPRDVDANTGATYTIILLNDPPILDPSPHDELALYYDVLRIGEAEVQLEQRWSLIYESGSKSDEIPCLPIILNP